MSKASRRSASEVHRDENGFLLFPDKEQFRPNLTPKEIFQMGAFGGTYFRPIYSSIVKKKLKDVWKELPSNWFEGLDIKTQVASHTYRTSVNRYKAKTGQSLETWEEKGWIVEQDPYGWGQWYCRFYLGRRTPDDDRQISRWKSVAGEKGRWRRNLIHKCVVAGKSFDDESVSPAVRQLLLHWGYALTEEHFDEYAEQVKGGKSTSFIPNTSSFEAEKEAEDERRKTKMKHDDERAQRRRKREKAR